jgi:hypothetical protein
MAVSGLQDRVKAAIESLYCGSCDIIGYCEGEGENGESVMKRVIVAQDVPCRLSFGEASKAYPTTKVADLSQEVILFVGKDAPIDEGCGVAVRQNGLEKEYTAAGVASVYGSHKEVRLMTGEAYA